MNLKPFLFITVTALLVGLVSSCGKKGPLYIPTAEQQAEMEKEQQEREAVLKRREQLEQTQQTNSKQETP
jgi:predicted small lipoprotein YifL